MSYFRKCDMHLHSRREGYDKENFIQKVTASGLDVICITDHNFIDIDILENVELKDKISNFAGFELNVHISKKIQKDEGLSQGKTNFFHAIIWIKKDNAIQSQELLKQLFENSSYIYDKANDEYHNHKLTLESIDDFINKTKEVSVCIEDFKKTFSEISYYFIPHENKQSGRGLSDYLPNDNPTNAEYKLALLKYNNVAIEGKSGVVGNKNRGNSIIIDYLKREKKVLSTTFSFSDAVSLEKIGQKFMWINFDGTFEGMILPFTDFETRVKKVENFPINPQENINKYMESLNFKLGDEEIQLNFSPGFNAIIGSRGSGKSLLGKIIGDRYEEKGLSLDMARINKFRNNSSQKATNLKGIYIGQNYFESIFSFGKDFDSIDYIKDVENSLLFQRKTEIKNEIQDIKKLLKYLKEKTLEYVAIEKKLSFDMIKEINEAIVEYEEFKYESKGNKNLLKKIVGIKKSKIDLNKVEKNELLGLEYDSVNNQIDTIKKLEEELNKEIENLKDIVKENEYKFTAESKLEDKIIEFNQNIELLNRNISSEEVEKKNNIKNIKEYFSRTLIFGYEYNILVREISKLLLVIEQKDQKDKFKVDNNRYIRDSLKGDIEEIEYEISLSLEDTVNLEEICSEYNIEFNKFFLGIIEGNLGSIKRDKRKMKSDTLEKFVEEFYNIISKEIDKRVTKVKLEVRKNGRDFRTDLSQGERAQAMLDIIFEKEISNKIDYIILDQPEDNLDNKTITSDLIHKIRNNKIRIQMFIISHSAPVVINGDADTIIVCEKDDKENKFEFKYGEINNTNIKKDIINILDGGEMNLNMRYYKYEIDKKELK